MHGPVTPHAVYLTITFVFSFVYHHVLPPEERFHVHFVAVYQIQYDQRDNPCHNPLDTHDGQRCPVVLTTFQYIFMKITFRIGVLVPEKPNYKLCGDVCVIEDFMKGVKNMCRSSRFRD